MSTPKPMQGTWTLTAPDGRTWQAESPLHVVGKESRERIPASVALERIYAAADSVVDPPYAARIAGLSRLSPEGMLKELLAAVHGDGGHYSDDHGLAVAVADAEIKWYATVSKADAGVKWTQPMVDDMKRRAEEIKFPDDQVKTNARS